MKRPVEWSEWVARIRQDIDPLEDMGDPYRVDADGDPLDPDLFLDTLAELESRGVPKDSLVALVSPAQVAGLLDRVNFLDRQPAARDEPELPEDMTLHGVPIRTDLGFPTRDLVLCDPGGVSLSGDASYPSGVAVVENLSPPDLDEASLSAGDVRRSALSTRDPRVQGGEPGEDAPEQGEEPDPERRGTRFVETPDEDPREEDEQEGDV